MAIPAEGWFLYAAEPGEEGRPGKLVRERYELADLEDGEVLLAPLYGSFEANLGRA